MGMAKKPSYKELEERLEASEKEVACLGRAKEKAQHLVADLERRNEELQQLAHTASRDLQEALEIVTRYLRFVEARYKGRLDSDANEFIASAVEGANRMNQVINNLLVCFSNQNSSRF
jgi:light-regulated signal transduction histidine kinase (bacteriophytochrome)